jgi:NhaP-type Na+/H+ or K+/H+ antiporter
MQSVAIAAALVVAYGLVSRRLATTPVTGPMAFVGAGLLLGEGGLGVLDLGIEEEGVRILAEATLVLVLFVDAIAIDVRALVREIQLPARLLTIGLPLTVVLGTGVALLVVDLQLWEAALLAAILAPTDAALGQAVVTNPRVPERIRQTLSVESGLNDGIVLPLVTLFVGLAAEETMAVSGRTIATFVASQLGFGALVGVGMGLLGGMVIDRAAQRGWMDGLYRQLSVFGLAFCSFAVADVLGGNGFIAAFVAGVTFGQVASEQCADAADFADDEGQLLTLLTFLVFGAALAAPALADAPQPWTALYAVLSLTIVRAIPTTIALTGTGLSVATKAFIGWFGPRGLASILFSVLILEEADLPAQDAIIQIVTWTVLLSVVAHGASARPAADAYGRHASTMHSDAAEHLPIASAHRRASGSTRTRGGG